MRVQIGAYTEDGRMVEDWSGVGEGWRISNGEHGCETLTGFVRRSPWEIAYWWARKKTLRVRASAGGRLFEGRLEDVAPAPGGMRVTALGGFRAYADVPYKALWSSTGYANWEPVTSDDNSGYNAEIYEIDNNNRLYIAPTTDQSFTDAADRGGLVFRAPHNGEKKIKAISFTYEMPIAAGWSAQIIGYDEGFTGGVVSLTITGGAAQSGAQVVTLATAKDYVVLALYRTSVKAAFTGDTGNVYIKLTNVRITTTVDNDVDTTLGTTILSGSRTVTPGSMNNIYLGQALMIGGAVTERVLVTAVTATTFTATFANGHNNTDTVKALYVSAGEVVESLVAYVAGINPNQVNDSTGLVEDTERDLLDALWEDQYPADIMTELAEEHNFEVGVGADRLLFFRPRGSAAKTWYVDASIELERTLEAVRNSAYGVYADERGRTLRTAVSFNARSVAEYGLTRQAAVFADTTDNDRAEDERDDFIDTYAEPDPRAGLQLDRAHSSLGVAVPLYLLKAGDYVKARNVWSSPEFLIARAEYAPETDTLTVEPFVRPASVADVLAKSLTTGEKAARSIKGLREKVRVL